MACKTNVNKQTSASTQGMEPLHQTHNKGIEIPIHPHNKKGNGAVIPYRIKAFHVCHAMPICVMSYHGRSFVHFFLLLFLLLLSFVFAVCGCCVVPCHYHVSLAPVILFVLGAFFFFCWICCLTLKCG